MFCSIMIGITQRDFEQYIFASNRDLVIFVVNQSPGLSYGLGTYTRSICSVVKNSSEMDFLGMVLCCNIDSIQFKIDDGCPFYFMPTLEGDRSDYYKGVVYFIASRISAERKIVVHLNYATQLSLAIHAKAILNAKVLYTQHYMDWAINFGGDVRKLFEEIKDDKSYTARKFCEEKQMMNECHRIIVAAQHACKTLEGVYNIDGKKVSIIPHAVYRAHKSYRKSMLRKKYNLSEDDRILLYVGRLDDNKNIRILLKSFSKINIPNVYLWVVGDGHLNLYINEIELKDWKRVCFWGYRMPSVISEMYSIAELGIVPSKYEEFGYVALEMMSSGLSVILNNTTGLKELASRGSAQTYEGCVETLTDVIEKALRNPSFNRSSYIEQKLRQYYSHEKFEASMIEVYKMLASSV